MNISVVIPLYNAEEYIIETLKSLINQTYPIDEILVIDDCGTDRSSEIVEEFSKRYPVIKLIRQTHNQGSSAARNRGLAEARNEWVLMMDADDLAHPSLLEKEVNYLLQNLNSTPMPVCVHPAYVQINSDGEIIENSEFRGAQYSFNDLVGTLLVRNHIITSSGTLLNKNAVLDIGGYRTDLAISEDVELYLRLAKKGIFLYVDDILIYYRRHFTNATSNFKKVSNAGKNLLEIYGIDEIKDAILQRNYPKNKNLIDFITVLYQYEKYDEGYRYLLNINDYEYLQKKLFLQSIYYLVKENWDEAVNSLDKLLALNNQHGATLNNRAVLYAKMGDFEKAKTLLNKAIQLFPGYMDATNNLRVLEEGKGEYRFTKRELRKNLLRYS